MIKKQFVKSRKITKLTFELPSDIEADQVQLLADFNDWEPVEFDQLKNGKWKLVQEVEPGQEYQFRYRVLNSGNEDWWNDEDADRTVQNDRGTENCVISA